MLKAIKSAGMQGRTEDQVLENMPKVIAVASARAASAN
jgi:hypothetical protein